MSGLSIPDHKESFFGASKSLFANSNFVCVVLTAVGHMAIYQAIEPFTLLYLRDLGISYFRIGVLNLIFSLVSILTVLCGSWLADTILLHHQSKAASANFLIWGAMCVIYSRITGFWSALIVFIVAAFSFTFRSASRAYLLQQSGERQHFAMGFHSLHKVPLVFMFLLILDLFKDGFVEGMRSALFWGGLMIVFMGLIRWVFLDDDVAPPSNSDKREPTSISLKRLITENRQTIRWLWKIAPFFLMITVIDASSDALYGFLSIFFLNEQAGITEVEILKGRLLLDIASIPFILYFAFRINKKNGRKTFLGIYTLVPVSIGLLLLSMIYPTMYFLPKWIPLAFRQLAFIAYALKLVTDWLWICLLAPLAIKFAPENSKAKAIGISWLLVHLSCLFASPVAGWIYGTFSNGTCILLVMILALNVIILVSILAGDFGEKSKKTNKTDSVS